MTLPANIRVIVRVPFPALVQGASFITVAKANGIWTLKPNYQVLAPAAGITSTQLLATYDSASGVWNTVTPAQLGGGGGGAGALLAANNLSDVASKPVSFNNISPMTTAGDLIYGGSAGAATRLPAGTSAQVLFGGATPFWGSPPGATGLPVVNSIAALQALTPSIGAINYLNAGVRSGVFSWVAGAFTTLVTNDPGKFIWVASGADPTGSTGVWARVIEEPEINLGWGGLVADGVIIPSIPFGPPTIVSGTDNAPVLANWGTLARFFSNNGQTVIAKVPPLLSGANCIQFNMNNCMNFNIGIKKLDWHNNGILWQNTAAPGTPGGTTGPWCQQTRALFGTGGAGQMVSLKIATTNLSVPILTASYNSGTGALTIGLGAGYEGLNLATGSIVTITGLGGTGSFAQCNVTNAVAIAGSSGTALVLQLATGLTMTVTVGGAAAVTQGTGFIAVTAASYNSTTGIVTLNLAVTAISIIPNSTLVSATGFGGTGSFAAANVTNVQVTTVVNNAQPPVQQVTYQIATGLTMTLTTSNVMFTQNNSFGLAGFGLVVLSASAAAGFFNVDDMILVSSIDAQYGGFPPNAGRFEFLIITAIATVGTSLVITTRERIRYQHRWDFPDNINNGVTVNAVLAIGAARAIPLNSPNAYTVNGINIGIVPFRVKHRYYDLVLGCCLGAPNLAGFYAGVNGEDIEYYNYVGPGDSPSVAKRVKYHNPTFVAAGEPDKLVDSYELDGLTFNTGLGTFGAVGFQSNFNRVHIKNSTIDYNLTIVPSRHATVETSYIAGISSGTAGLGLGRSTIFDNCHIANCNTLTAVDGGQQLTIDNSTTVFFGTASPGTLANVTAIFPNVTTWNGIITVNIVNVATLMAKWNVEPGQSMSLIATGGVFTGSNAAVNGNMVVTGLCQDATYYYILTTSQFATLPTWVAATLNIWSFHANAVRFRECDGHSEVVMASEADRLGFKYWEYFKYYVGGNYPLALNLAFQGKIYGHITSVTVTVINPGSAAGAKVTITIPSYNSASNFAADSSNGTVIVCFVGLYGKRIFQEVASVGLQGSDAVTVGGAAGTTLLAGRVYAGVNNQQMTFNVSGATAGSQPQFVVEIQMECGATHRAHMGPDYDISGNNIPVFASQGLVTA